MKHAIILVTILACSAFFLNAKSEEAVTLEIHPKGDDTYQIDAYLKMNAPEELLWKAISEYEQTPAFVESIISSKVLKREGSKVLLDMNGGGEFLYFVKIRVHLLLDMVETVEAKKIDFVETSGDEFISFKGFWQVRKEGDKGVVHLSLLEKPVRSYFGITRRIITNSVTGLFESIQKKVQKDLAVQTSTKP